MPARFTDQEVISGLKKKRALSFFLDELLRGHLKIPKRIQLQYIFCTDIFLLKINQQHLGHDTLTDIITFDLSDSKDNLNGELYISIERIKENAGKYNVSYNDELLRVIFHGALHLCGYKDKKAADKKEMRKHEDNCLEKYKKILP